MPFYQAAVNTLFIFSVSNMFNSLSHSFSKTLPFSRENTLINSGQRIFSMVLAVVFGIPVIALQFFVYRSMLDAAVASIIVITVTYWLNYFIFVREKKIS
jgi:Zn-dependent protease with chaperone function